MCVEEVIGSIGARVTDRWELSNMSVENPTQAFWRAASALNHGAMSSTLTYLRGYFDIIMWSC